jgi:hypothetical protein
VESWPEETIPVFHTRDAEVAMRWYARLGFAEEWTHRYEPTFPAFVSIRRGPPGAGVRIFLSEHGPADQPRGSLYLRVADIGPVAGEFGAEVHDAVSRLEVVLDDPDGNHLTLGAMTGVPTPGYTYPDPE